MDDEDNSNEAGEQEGEEDEGAEDEGEEDEGAEDEGEEEEGEEEDEEEGEEEEEEEGEEEGEEDDDEDWDDELERKEEQLRGLLIQPLKLLEITGIHDEDEALINRITMSRRMSKKKKVAELTKLCTRVASFQRPDREYAAGDVEDRRWAPFSASPGCPLSIWACGRG